ncbi:MAG: hypothetical protein ABWX89_09830, partial [Paeniglutamicibacter terrestris]
ARDPMTPPGFFDAMQLILIGSALAVNAAMLAAMLARIAEFGFSPNKVAALGLNLLLLVHLVRAIWLGAGFQRGSRSFASLEHWQTQYLPVYGLWAVVVVLIFPLAFVFA